MTGDGNQVVAVIYGRSDDGDIRPLRTDAFGNLGGGIGRNETVSTLHDWADTAGVAVLTPLDAFAPYGDTLRGLLYGFRVDPASPDGALFIVEASEDGVLPSKTSRYEFALQPGEHDVFESNVPLMRRYWRLSVQPLGAGPCNVGHIVRQITR